MVEPEWRERDYVAEVRAMVADLDAQINGFKEKMDAMTRGLVEKIAIGMMGGFKDAKDYANKPF